MAIKVGIILQRHFVPISLDWLTLVYHHHLVVGARRQTRSFHRKAAMAVEVASVVAIQEVLALLGCSRLFPMVAQCPRGWF